MSRKIPEDLLEAEVSLSFMKTQEGHLLFQPLKEGRNKEILEVAGIVLDELGRNPRATVGDFKRAIKLELFELNSATEMVSSLEELRQVCIEDQARRGWGDPNWPDRQVDHEREHIDLGHRADPRVKGQLGFVHVASIQESGIPVIDFPNLLDVYREDKGGVSMFFDRVVGGHSQPSDCDFILVNGKRQK